MTGAALLFAAIEGAAIIILVCAVAALPGPVASGQWPVALALVFIAAAMTTLRDAMRDARLDRRRSVLPPLNEEKAS